MPDFLKGSKIVSVILKIAAVFVNSYGKSRFKTAVDKVYSCFRQSITRRILSMYANKKPWYRYSLTYRLVHFFADIADKALGGIYKIVKYMLKGSKTAEDCKRICTMTLTDKCYCVGVLLISLPVGALLASIVFKSFTVVTVVMCWAMFIAGVMVVLVAVYGRNSIIVKLIRYFIAVIK